jgi:hypothetical protein
MRGQEGGAHGADPTPYHQAPIDGVFLLITGCPNCLKDTDEIVPFAID